MDLMTKDDYKLRVNAIKQVREMVASLPTLPYVRGTNFRNEADSLVSELGNELCDRLVELSKAFEDKYGGEKTAYDYNVRNIWCALGQYAFKHATSEGDHGDIEPMLDLTYEVREINDALVEPEPAPESDVVLSVVAPQS